MFEDVADPLSVIVQMRPDAPTGAFLQFAREAHQAGRPYARHLPNPGALESVGDDAVRFRTGKLEPNNTRARVGRENGGFYMTGLGDADPQRASILEAMRDLDLYIKQQVPPSHRYFYDLGPQNFMRRRDGTLVINDPIEFSGIVD